MASRPTGRPRTKPAGEGREDLVSAAERLFLEKGVEQTTIEDITIGAAVSKGAFYLHFSSKADVVEALRSRFVDGMLERIRDEVGRQPDNDWDGKLRAWARACAVGNLDTVPLHGIIFSAAPSPPRTGLTRNILIDHLVDLLTDGNRHGAWALTDPPFTAIFLFNGLHGIVTCEEGAANDPTRGNVLRRLESHFRNVVGQSAD